MRLFKSLVVIVVCLIGIIPNADAQVVNPDLEVGFKPYGTYHGGDLDSINLSNNYLNIHIPLISFPQRGDISYAAVIRYNNKGWSVFPNCNKQTSVCSPVWQWKGKGVELNTDSPDDFGAVQGPLYNGSALMVYRATTADGSTRMMALKQGGGVESLDGTAIWFDGTAFPNKGISRSPNGLTANGASLVDRNGNTFSYSTTTPAMTDTLGRVLPTLSGGTSTSDFSGCTGPLPIAGAVIYSFPGTSGARLFKLCSVSVQLQSNFRASGYYNDLLYPIREAHPITGMLQSVVIYNGTSWLNSLAWTFEYSSRSPGDSSSVNYGDLTKITLPTGGTISYTWGFGSPCGSDSYTFPTPAVRRITSRTVDALDGTGPHTWTYYSSGLVTDPNGNDTVHTFTEYNGPCSLFETDTRFYQGSSSSGHLLKSVHTDYQWLPSPFENLDPNGIPAAINVFPYRVTTTWPNGQFSKIEKTYDSNLVFWDPLHSGWTTGSYGNVIETREYGYAATGGNPPLLRSTDYTYKAFDGSPLASSYLGLNLVHLVASATTHDGSGIQVAKVTYNYDESPLQPSGVGTQMTAVSNFRGNLTSESHWLNTTGGSITSHISYYDTGTPYQSTDPGQHVTTNFYGAGYQSLQTYAGAYITQVQNAITPAQNTYFDYDFTTGLRTRLKDPNGQETISTYDYLNRTTSTTLPDGGGTILTYNDAQPPSFTADTKISPTIDRISQANLDGIGRALHTTLVSDPEDPDTVDTTYDPVGAVKTVSNPHRAASWPTDGITTTIQDALGRVTQVTKQDGSIGLTDYSQFPTVTTTDEAGNLRRTRTDALGRLVEVDEPGVVAGVNSNYTAKFQTDGNLVVYDYSSQPRWASNSAGAVGPLYILSMQDSGNLVKFTPTWSTPVGGTAGPVTNYAPASCTSDALLNQNLPSGGCIVSPSGRFVATIQTAGNLVVYDRSYNPWAPVWANSGTGTAGSYLALQGDGNLVIYTPSNVPVWASNTADSNPNGTYVLKIQDQGNLVIYKDLWETHTTQSPVPPAAWSALSCTNVASTSSLGQVVYGGTTLNGGQCVISPGGRFGMFMQTDGNLVIYDRSVTPAASIWSTGTQLTPVDPLVALRTLYFYDTLGNLYCVEQHGTAATGTACPSTPPSPTTPVPPDPTNPWRRRMFGYDSLSRLLWASNPESGVIRYAYDSDGNLLQKTSPAPNQPTGSNQTQVISYCYDELHRVTGKAYSAQTCQGTRLPTGTAVVSYTYDSGTNGIGRLAHVDDQAGSADYTYDPMGRVATETRHFSGASGTITYEYNLDGSLKSLHYPSNRVVNYAVNGGSRVTAATDGNGTQYVVNATSYPPGAEYQISMPGIYFRTDMNPRLQVSGFYSDDGHTTSRFINKSYIYGAAYQNNGNISSIVNNKDTNRTQSFTYDALNRITSGWTTGNTGNLSWGENYTIDAWGNLQINPMGGKAHGGYLPNASTAQNQMTGIGYDIAGNLTNYTAPNQYFYDPENRIQLAGGMTYTYDADGSRVKKASGSTGTLYWYSSVGVIAETDLSGATKSEYVFFAGKRIARVDAPGNSLHYYLSDHLNSTSMIVSASGVPEEESDYSPYGTEYPVLIGSNHYKFTGKERDTETSPGSLDYFGARYYSSNMGRFMTPDWAAKPAAIPYADYGDPQSLNLYTFVRNIPTVRMDADGHDWIDPQAIFNTLSKLGNAIMQGYNKSGQLSRSKVDDGAFKSDTRFGSWDIHADRKGAGLEVHGQTTEMKFSSSTTSGAKGPADGKVTLSTFNVDLKGTVSKGLDVKALGSIAQYSGNLQIGNVSVTGTVTAGSGGGELTLAPGNVSLQGAAGFGVGFNVSWGGQNIVNVEREEKGAEAKVPDYTTKGK